MATFTINSAEYFAELEFSTAKNTALFINIIAIQT